MSAGPRVLHVVEAFGGGVADAVRSFVATAAHAEHHLLYALRDGITVDPATFTRFATAVQLPASSLRRITATRAAVRRVQPDIVHAHSSFAGVYARAAVSRHRTPIVYSPHCFSFERGDVSPFVRGVFRMVERALASNTSAFAACSYRELSLAHELSSRPAHLIVNIARVVEEHSAAPSAAQNSGAFTISMTGRLAPQKGIATFARLAREVVEHCEGVRTVWIGGGEDALAAPLRDAGVEVTGWLDPRGVSGHLHSTDLYVHTAEWEGFPVGLLEAVARGIPSLVLDRPYATGLPAEMVVSDAELADRSVSLVNDGHARERLAAVNAAALEGHTPQAQSQQLTALYEGVMAARPRRRELRTTEHV